MQDIFPVKEKPETVVSSRKRKHAVTDIDDIVPKKLRQISDGKLCYSNKNSQLEKETSVQEQEGLLNSKKQTSVYSSDRITLESETAKGIYSYWLSDQDIRKIASVEYNNLYDIYTLSDDYENSAKRLAIISDEDLDSEIVRFKEIFHINSDVLLQTFIINLRDNHWVTLVVSHQNGRYYGYYIDSLYFKDRAGNEHNTIPENISCTLTNKGVKVKDLKIHQQNDGHNCGLFALENAKDINDVLKNELPINKMLQRLQVPRDNYYFIERREYFVSKLKDDEREVETSIENSLFTSDINNEFHEIEESKLAITYKCNKFSNLQDSLDEVYDCDQYIFAKKRGYFSLIGIIYQLHLLMLCFYRAFVVHKYKTFSLATEKVGTGKFDDIVLYDKSKSICIQVKYMDVEKAYNNIGFVDLFPKGKRKWRGMFSINKYFNSFIQSEGDVKYLVLYTNTNLNLTERKKLIRARWDIGFFPLKFDSIDIEEEKYKILKDCLCTSDSIEKHDFYQFSQKNKTRRELLKLLESLPSVLCDAEELEEMKKKFLDKLILAVNQPNRETLSSIIRHEIEKSYGLDEISCVYNELHEKMMNYLASPEGIYITEKNAGKFFKYIKEYASMEYNSKQANKLTRKYNKAAGLRNYIPHIIYKLELLMLCLYRMYQHKHNDFFISAESGRVNIVSNFCFHYKSKITYVWTRYGSEGLVDYNRLFFNKEQKRGDKMFSINRYFIYFIEQLSTKVEEVENLVIYTNMGLNLTEEEKLKNVSIKFNNIDINKYVILRDYLYTGDGVRKHDFYQFSQDKVTKKFFLDHLDPWPYKYDAERLKELKRNFLDKLVLAVNQPDRKKLIDIIKHEIGESDRYISQNKVLRKYIALREAALRWLDAYKVHYIGRKGVKKLFKDIKCNKSSDRNIRIPDEDKDQFVRTIVADRGLCHFREFREFLDTKEGMDIFNVLYENKAECCISGMLASTGIEVINVFKRLYYMLFHKDGEKTNFLKSLIESGITLSNVSSMLTRVGNRAPEALEELNTILNTKLDGGKTYLELFSEKGIIVNISSMLNGAEHKAPEALKELYAILNSKLVDRKTYLEFFIEKDIMGNISSILSGEGHKAPEALKALCTMLSTKLDDGKTYLEFFVEKNIMGNISSMLCKARSKAPEALKALHLILSAKLDDKKTYLEFSVEKNIMGNLSSILSGSGHRAPEALEELYTILNMKLDDGKTYLEFFVEKNIMGNMSSILHGAGDKAPEAMKALYAVLSTKLDGGKTYLEFFVEKNIIGNISSILHGARDKAPDALKALYTVLSTELDDGKTYLEFFTEKKVMGNISSMLNGAGRKAPKALKALLIILSTRLSDSKTYLEFFIERNIMGNISGILSGAGHKASKALKALYAVLNTKLANGKTYLEFFIEMKIAKNIFGILGKAGYGAPEALKALHTILDTKLADGKTYLEYFIEKKVMGHISSILSGTGNKAPKVLKELHFILNTKLENGKTYLEFFIEKKVMRHISSMLSGAGGKAPEALKELYIMLNMKLSNGKTYLEFFVEKNIMTNISGILSGTKDKAPEALKELYTILNTKLDDKKTYLEFFVEKNIMGNISSMLGKAGNKAPETLKALCAVLHTKLNGERTYLEFFIEKKVMKNISSMLSGAGHKAPETLKVLYAVLCTKLNDEITYLEFFVEKKIMSNISSMLSGAGHKAPEALQTLFAVLDTKLSDEKTYLEFFVEKNIMGNISSMLSRTGNKAPEVLKELCNVLTTKLDDKRTYLEFFIEENIIGNMSSMLNRAGKKAPEALKELHALLFNEKYLEHFIKEGFELSNLSGMLHGTRANAPYTLKKVYDLCFDVNGNKTQYFSDLIKINHKPAKLFNILRKAAVAASSPVDEYNTSEVEDIDLNSASSKPSILSSKMKEQNSDGLLRIDSITKRKIQSVLHNKESQYPDGYLKAMKKKTKVY